SGASAGCGCQRNCPSNFNGRMSITSPSRVSHEPSVVGFLDPVDVWCSGPYIHFLIHFLLLLNHRIDHLLHAQTIGSRDAASASALRAVNSRTILARVECLVAIAAFTLLV